MQYNSQIEQQVNTAGMSGGTGGSSADDRDAYFVEARVNSLLKKKRHRSVCSRECSKSVSTELQESWISYVMQGVVGPGGEPKPRKVLMSAEEFENYIEEYL